MSYDGKVYMQIGRKGLTDMIPKIEATLIRKNRAVWHDGAMTFVWISADKVQVYYDGEDEILLRGVIYQLRE